MSIGGSNTVSVKVETAKFTNDPDIEIWHAEIKLRARRCIGELSAGLEQSPNQYARPTAGTSKTQALKSAGLSRRRDTHACGAHSFYLQQHQ